MGGGGAWDGMGLQSGSCTLPTTYLPTYRQAGAAEAGSLGAASPVGRRLQLRAMGAGGRLSSLVWQPLH